MPTQHRQPSKKEVDLGSPTAAKEYSTLYSKRTVDVAKFQVWHHAFIEAMRKQLRAEDESPLAYLTQARTQYQLIRPLLTKKCTELSRYNLRILKSIFEWRDSPCPVIRSYRVVGPTGLEAWWLQRNPSAAPTILQQPPPNRHYVSVPDARVARLVAIESTTPQLQPATITGLEQAQAAMDLRITQEFDRNPGVGNRTHLTRRRAVEGLDLAERVRDAGIDNNRQYNGTHPWV
jgi:hypothetical protein